MGRMHKLFKVSLRPVGRDSGKPSRLGPPSSLVRGTGGRVGPPLTERVEVPDDDLPRAGQLDVNVCVLEEVGVVLLDDLFVLLALAWLDLVLCRWPL